MQPDIKIKCLRIHHDVEQATYEVFDRYGTFRRTYHQAIKIINPGKVTYFGFCPIETDDVTIEFETPISSRQIKINH